MDKKELLKTISLLSNMHGISGFENSLEKEIVKLFEPYVDEIFTDALGNIIAHKKSKKPDAKKLMIDAHADEIGLMVTKIDDKGFLKFTNVGGIDERILPAREVIVHGKKDLLGIIGIKPPHLQSEDENKKTLEIEDLAIDIGMDYKAAIELVEPGSAVSFCQEVCKLSGDQITGKSFDDRASISALLYTAQKLCKTQLNIDLYFVISTFEETNLAGAKCAAYSINPDAALVIDVTHAKTPDNTDCVFETGGGIAYSVGPNIYPPFAKLIKAIAEKCNICAFEEVDGGNTGTNAWATQTVQTGIPSAVLSLPLKYMHTPTEVISIDDVINIGEVIKEFVLSLNGSPSYIPKSLTKLL